MKGLPAGRRYSVLRSLCFLLFKFRGFASYFGFLAERSKRTSATEAREGREEISFQPWFNAFAFALLATFCWFNHFLAFLAFHAQAGSFRVSGVGMETKCELTFSGEGRVQKQPATAAGAKGGRRKEIKGGVGSAVQ
jgi:hypothetical protein